jgi:biotin carboxylase
VSQHSVSIDGSQRRDGRILIVGGGPFQLEIIRAAKRLVREVWVIDRNPNAPGMALADRAEAVDFGNPEMVVDFAREHGFDAVTSAASDVAVRAVAGCVEALGINGIGTAVARRCRDKLETVNVLQQAGHRAPLTGKVVDIAGARSAIGAVGGYPAVIKPRFGSGGRGVSVVDSDGDLEMAIEKVRRYRTPDGGFLVQELIRGHSVGVEAFMWNGRLAAGLCLSDQYTEGFVSPVGHGLPDDLDEAGRARVLRAVEEYCKALAVNDGPINFDLRDTSDGLCLIEANPRLGGNSITPLVRASCGVDLAAATVLAALGEEPTGHLSTGVDPVPYATRLIMVRGLGTRAVVRQYSEQWQQHPDVIELEIITREGEGVAFTVDDWALLGRCLVKGRTREEAIDLARRVVEDMQSQVTLVPPRP